jgi:tetratricopeptide (TPR) repeat protein
MIIDNRTIRPDSGRRPTAVGMVLFVFWITFCGAALTAAQTKQGSGAKASDDDSFEILPPKVHQHVILADQLAGAGKYDEAIAEYRAAIKEAGRPVFTAYLNMGSVYFYQQNNTAAVDAYRQATAIKPSSWRAHYNLAEALYASDQYAEAEKEYRSVLTVESGVLAIRAHHFLGLALYKQGRLDEAIAEYRTAIEKAEGKYAEARYNLGISLLEQKNPVEAEQQFKLAVEQEKKPWPEAQYNLAKAIEAQKRYREAADAYEVYLKLSPDAEDAKRMREYIDYLRRRKN